MVLKWSSLSQISAYKRADAHLTRQTTHGAIVTLLGVILGITLATHEISWYLSGKETSKMMVDLARRHDLNIHVDITFPAIPCAGLSVDVMDASGTAGNDANHAKGVHLHKIRLDGRGKRLSGKAGEYVTPQSQKLVHDAHGDQIVVDLGASMAQMSDMDEEMQKHEGCRVHGDLSVRRVAGKIHFAVHQQSFLDVLPQMLTGHVLPKLTNMSHVIHKVAFGPEFPGQVNPLDGFNRIIRPDETPKAFKYFLKIVPTEYQTRMGMVLETSQYSVSEYGMPLKMPEHPHPNNSPASPANPRSEHHQQPHKLAEAVGAGPAGGGVAGPGAEPVQTVQNAFVDFSYDLSPIVMMINQSPSNLLHFIVRLCAVVGGVLSVTRMADKLVHAVLVAAGVVVLEGGSGKERSTSTSSAGFPISARNSLPGDATAYISGGGGSRGYGNSYPVRTSSSGGGAYSSGGLLPDGNLHQRVHGSHPGSHPLSRLNSTGSSMSGVSGGGGLLPNAQNNSYGGAAATGSGAGAAPLYSMNSGGSMRGSFPGGSYGGVAQGAVGGPSSGSGSVVVGDAIQPAVKSMGGNAGASAGPSSGGAGQASHPTAAGHVSHLLSGYGGGLAAAAPLAASHSGSFSPAGPPMQQQQQVGAGMMANGVGSSRLSAASGPGAGAPGSPFANRGLGSGQFSGQQYSR